MRKYHKTIITLCFGYTFCMMQTGCKKLIAIPAPINTITTEQVFSTEAQANSAMAGIYTRMINGEDPSNLYKAGTDNFSAALTTLHGGLSSDELYYYNGLQGMEWFSPNANKLTIYNNGRTAQLWQSAYTTIYGANSVVEGIAASTSLSLRDSARKALTGEAKFVRAFAYFYLTNFFGAVPLALTPDFSKTAVLPRAPQQEVYQQILEDLKDGAEHLPGNYPTTNNERVRPNRFAAKALLARVYLYLGDYANAAATAAEVISHVEFYQLENDLNTVFLKGSHEAIWQLQQANTDPTLKNATPEGMLFLPIKPTQQVQYCLSANLMKTFEDGDQRRVAWTDSTNNTNDGVPSPGITYYPKKYKVGLGNGVAGADPTEYYVVLRLAEVYLIRAEAAANGGPGGLPAAIADLNTIRKRAGLKALPASLSKEQVLAAVAKERQIELLAEWGHRWFDLKRTGKAHDVLSVIGLKQPWAGDYQLLYPIPNTEITANHFLTQNAGY
jgi:starch-binding outer membrane protein, SusD/RagB family